MPLEIKELHIKTTITKGGNPTGGGGDSSGNSEQQKAEWMQECIDKVLEILAAKQER